MRSFILALLLIILTIPLLIINWLCLALDNLFYPVYRKTEIRPPVFIIGMFRSATTLCQNLMKSDAHNFSFLRMWELLLAPSILQKKLINQIKRLDKGMNGAIYNLAARIDRFLFQSLENHHPMRLLSMEEDHFMYTNTLTAPALWMLAPGLFKMNSVLKRYDFQMPRFIRKLDMFYYKTCIRRHLYVYGHGRRYLSKCPPNSIRIRTLQSAFPGCRFVYMLRDPLYSISSSISLFTQFRNMFFLKTDFDYMKSITLEMGSLFHRYPLVECSDLKGKTLFVVTFKELIGDTRTTIHQLYNNLGLPIGEELEQLLLNVKDTVDQHKTKNKYTPEQFGLTPAMFREKFDYVYNEYPDISET